MPADYRDELQAFFDFISETQVAPEGFRSFHWMISTSDHWRFADSSAMLGGPFDMSDRVTRAAPSSFVLDAVKKTLSFPHIYAAEISLPFETMDAREVVRVFAGVEPDRVLIVVANGQRLLDKSGWSLKLVFVGMEQANRFLNSNAALLAATKPLEGRTLYSKRPSAF